MLHFIEPVTITGYTAISYLPPLIDKLQCTGKESSLIACNHTLLTSHDQCSPSQNVAVRCKLGRCGFYVFR